MDDGGYTLVDAMTALLVIGLTIVGVTEAVRVISSDVRRLQVERGQTVDLTDARRVFADLPGDLGPFQLEGGRQSMPFQGSEQAISLSCGLAAACQIRLVNEGKGMLAEVTVGDKRRVVALSHVTDARFTFVAASDGLATKAWPNGRSDDRLAAVVLNANQAPAAVLRLANAQSGSCVFDIERGACEPPDVMAHDNP